MQPPLPAPVHAPQVRTPYSPAPAPSVPIQSTNHAVPTPAAQSSESSTGVQQLHISVVYKTRTIDLSVGTTPIVADLLPDIARRLGVLDPAIVYGGYRLIDREGNPLSPSQTLEEQHITEGSTFTLEPGALNETDIVYDDVVEAVGASVQSVHKPWTKNHTTLTSLIISAGMLTVSAGCLAVFSPTIVNATLGFGFAIILIALCSVLDRKNIIPQALTVGLISSAFAAIGGYQLIATLFPGNHFYGLPLLGAAAGSIIAGGLMAVAAPRTKPYALIPVIIGALTVIPSGLAFMFPLNERHIWIFTATAIAIAANGLPTMCLSLARISVNSPHSESDIFKLPEDIDYEDIKQRYIFGSTMLFIGRIAVAALLLIVTPLLTTLQTPLGAGICLLAFMGMLLDSRQIYTLREMIVTVGAAGIGIITTGLLTSQTHPELSIPLTLIMLASALITVIFTNITHQQSLFATRVADAAEILCIVLLPPFAYLAIIA
ncbi:type VII secretion protein [Bifidobacterium sp. LC6]|uniref:Type VII secretion protein n=2 Tax=Bifidobacterium colobi TaxID=2809026 RepID=A0ABS5UUQ6_9BIFI|nr:type VII secretion protein [Bifidobacterium colobi]